jgi:hypothetical protein
MNHNLELMRDWKVSPSQFKNENNLPVKYRQYETRCQLVRKELNRHPVDHNQKALERKSREKKVIKVVNSKSFLNELFSYDNRYG